MRDWAGELLGQTGWQRNGGGFREGTLEGKEERKAEEGSMKSASGIPAAGWGIEDGLPIRGFG